MTPRLIIKRLPIINSSRITVAKPVKARPASLRYNVWIAKPTANRKKITPANVTTCNGKEENVVIPIKASFARLR